MSSIPVHVAHYSLRALLVVRVHSRRPDNLLLQDGVEEEEEEAQKKREEEQVSTVCT